MSKFFAALLVCLSVLHNYFDSPRKLFPDLIYEGHSIIKDTNCSKR